MKSVLCLFVFLSVLLSLRAQESFEVRGKVAGAYGWPVRGASIQTADGKAGTASDVDGHFVLRIPVGTKTLLVSFIGMETRKVRVKNSMVILLEKQIQELDEIMVTAYGTSRKGTFSGSAFTLKQEELKERPISVIPDALDGLIPGVQVGEANGQPGAGAGIRIRGFGSINADNEPIYVVDGAIYRGPLCDLNPDDIESLTVLKDAVATALYGSGSGNGVVLITLKSARQGKPTLRFGMKQGLVDRAIPEYDRVGIREYYPLEWEMLRNGLISKGSDEAEANAMATAGIYGRLNSNPFEGVNNEQIVLPDGSLNPAAQKIVFDDLDWESAIRRKGYRGEYNISYGLGNEKSDLYASVGYLKENAYLINSDLERFSGRVSGNIRPVNWLKTGLSLNVVRTNSNMANTRDNATNLANPFYTTRYIGPIYPIHAYDIKKGEYMTDATKSRIYDYGIRGEGSGLGDRNIVDETATNTNYSERNGINARGYVDLYLFEGFRATVNLTANNNDERNKRYEMKGPASSPGRLYATDIRTTTITVNELLSYTRDIGRHSLSALAGHESFSYKYEYLTGYRQDQILDEIFEMSNFQTLSRLNSSTDNYRKEGYFLQAAWRYDQTYHLSASWRRDGSSRFREDHRWGNFWSVGAAWRIEQEKFMEHVRAVDYLKLRASYGVTGNDNILQSTLLPNTFASNYYPYQSLYNIGLNNALESGIAFSSFGNSDLKWETQISFDVALEFGLCRWLSGSAEYFQKNSRDLLFNVPQVISSGSPSVWMNVGHMTNKGVELALNAKVIHTRDWEWELGANATFVKNNITRMPASQPEIVDGTRKLKAGEPLFNHWLKEYRGVDPNTGDAQFTFDSENYGWNDKVCFVNGQGDSLTYYSTYARNHYAGSPVPKMYGGITTAVRYKNLELSGVLAYSIGGKVYNTGYSFLMTNGKYGQSFHTDIRRRWQKPGDVTDIPRLDDGVANKRLGGINSASQANAVSDRWLFNAGYLNIKSIILRYRLPAALFVKCGIQDAEIYVSGENLYFLSAMKGMDPRQAFKGVITVANTPARTFTLGLSVTL